jgi:hypothetical protein
MRLHLILASSNHPSMSKLNITSSFDRCLFAIMIRSTCPWVNVHNLLICMVAAWPETSYYSPRWEESAPTILWREGASFGILRQLIVVIQSEDPDAELPTFALSSFEARSNVTTNSS